MSLNRHRMQLPREVIIGDGTIDLIGEVTRRLGFRKSAVIISGSKTYVVAGKTIKTLLEEVGVKVDTMFVKSATRKDVESVERKIKILKPQVVFGVGGGTKIDVAKLSSARQNTQFISVPTTASHDGIGSPLSSIKDFEKPYSVMAQAPIAIIADTEIIMSSPWRLVVSGCADVISKFTAVHDWELAKKQINEYYGEYAASLALMSAKLVTQNAERIKQMNEEGVRILLEALISCGVAMSIAGSSRPCSGSEHLFSHALDIVKPNKAMHGEKCGVGAIMMAFLQGQNWRRIKKKLKQLKAPTNASELGVGKEDIVKALAIAPTIRPERYTILNDLKLNSEAYTKLGKVTGIF